MSVTSPTPPTGTPPVPLVAIHTHIVTWMSTPWTRPTTMWAITTLWWSVLFFNNLVTKHHCDNSHLHRLWRHDTFVYLFTLHMVPSTWLLLTKHQQQIDKTPDDSLTKTKPGRVVHCQQTVVFASYSQY